MAALIVQSRFAGLKIEDDDHPSSVDGAKSKKAKLNSAKKAEPPKKAKANNNNKTQNVAKKKKAKQPASTSEQWESWKQKDEELVDGNFEDDLQQAILLSKLDFEAKKDVYKQAEVEKKITQTSEQAKSNKKQKKKNVMSLEQFNVMVAGEDPLSSHEEDRNQNESLKSPKTPLKDTEFFERVSDDTKKELTKEMFNDRLKYRQSLPDEVITRVQFADALERKDQEIEKLKEEITHLKDELFKVKTRNKKLYQILGQGEMKDKAEVLVEVERLRQVQAELTAEMEALHCELQRERSRNTDPRAKDKKKKGANTEKEK